MKINRIYILFLLLLVGITSLQARKQWTEKQAWEWEKRVGVIKGFNIGGPAYPGMKMEGILEKAQEMGYNSFRAWYGGPAENVIKRLKEHVKIAEKYNMTISPVLCVPVPKSFWDSKGTDAEALRIMKEYTQKVIAGVAKEKRIIFWDIWNEPGCGANFMPTGDDNFIYSFKAIELILGWALEMNPIQALTSSIYWTGSVSGKGNPVKDAAWELESKMDIHNFHSYACCGGSEDQGSSVQTIVIDELRKISNRPLVCTECLTHYNNSGLSRTFAVFAKNNVHFYQWGFYSGDANWTVLWGRSAYDPYDAEFHNVMRPNDDLINIRDAELVRNYKFTNGVSTDIGAEYTDKWESDRAWKWMATGPVMGKSFVSVADAMSWLSTGEANKGFNSINVKLSYAEYKAGADNFFGKLDALLAAADGKTMTVLFTLLSDDDIAGTAPLDLAKYEAKVIRRYLADIRVRAWDLYYQPGIKTNIEGGFKELMHLLFRYARCEFPNQPVMATPVVKAKDFPENFNYRDAFLHGRRNGWNMLQYDGNANAELCYTIWKLSDVISFTSNQSAPQTGWVKTVAFRYGRPIFCNQWQPLDEANAKETLDNFSRSHIYWYQQGNTPLPNVAAFKFKPISTPH